MLRPPSCSKLMRWAGKEKLMKQESSTGKLLLFKISFWILFQCFTWELFGGKKWHQQTHFLEQKRVKFLPANSVLFNFYFFCLQRNRLIMKLQTLFVLLLFTCMYMSLAQGKSITFICVVIFVASFRRNDVKWNDYAKTDHSSFLLNILIQKQELVAQNFWPHAQV